MLYIIYIVHCEKSTGLRSGFRDEWRRQETSAIKNLAEIDKTRVKNLAEIDNLV